MAARKSSARASPRSAAAEPSPASSAVLNKALTLMARWPQAWQIDDEGDLRYGEDLLALFKPFVTHLVLNEELTEKSVRRHLDNLFLLGGELISLINTFDEDRRRRPARLLDLNLSPLGGPSCRHVERGAHRQQFDATCKKLYAFRSAQSHAH